MTVQAALAMADTMRPNMMPRPTKLVFLNEIEQQIHGEIILKHAHIDAEKTCETIDADTDPERELLIPAPYDKVYWRYIICQIDDMNQEMDKYNNDRALFEHEYSEMADWVNRTRMPISTVREIQI